MTRVLAIILIGFTLAACQSALFRCKESPNTYCPK
jgi:hypothetical protein